MRDRLSWLIDTSGLSIAEWARTVVGRDERTVRRWLAGEPIPNSVTDWLGRISHVRVSPENVVLEVRR
jgi:hypothetical protein